MKKIVSLLLAIGLAFTFAACSADKETLATPSNVQVSESGVISWNAVENATEYVVVINGTEYEVSSTSYQPNVSGNFTYSVYAKAENYLSSAPSEEKTYTVPAIEPSGVTVGISGKSEVKSGESILLLAEVNGTPNTNVTWAVTEGSEYATISEAGRLQAKEVTGDKIVKVSATSKADGSVVASKAIVILSKPTLTQAMLDEAASSDTVGFTGYVNIGLYTFGIWEELASTFILDVSTSMNGTNWYAEYTDSSTGLKGSLYYANHNDVACQVSVSFANEEEYTPMVDDGDREISWEAAGLYNNFKGLTVNDFAWNAETWRYEYVGDDETLPMRMAASANPYDFNAVDFSLLIDGNTIIGFRANSTEDYTLSLGYKAKEELVVAMNVGTETVDVPTISKYGHEDFHDDLTAAIANMQALESYTLDFTELTASYYMSSGYVESGFVETITQDNCYFLPFTVTTIRGSEQRVYSPEGAYGYKQIPGENLYNTYYRTEDGFEATRAYEEDFSAAKPSFAFAAEIFTQYYYDEEDGTTTYFVDDYMSPVAANFYKGVGNDIALYGMFATRGYISTTQSFTPYVVVKDGYIVEAVFYFYLGSVYGVVEIEYGDFNAAAIPDDLHFDFEARRVPDSWAELTIIASSDSSTTDEDYEMNALEYLQNFFGDETIGERMPFFGAALGDTYGFGLPTTRTFASLNKMCRAIGFYYDVPLDTDYTIDSSIRKVEQYLVEQGFERNGYGEYVKGDIAVQVVDSSLDLLIYVCQYPTT